MIKEVEEQLEELLENHPNEEKPERRRRNKKKDLVKKAKRGEGYKLIHSIIDTRIEEKIKQNPIELSVDDLLVTTYQKVVSNYYYIDAMLSQEEIEEMYPDCSVTQNKKLLYVSTETNEDGSEKNNYEKVIELAVKQYEWIFTTDSYSGISSERFGMTFASDCPMPENLVDIEFPINQLSNLFGSVLGAGNINDIYNHLYNVRLDYNTRELYDYYEKNLDEVLTEEELEKVRKIKEATEESNWIDEVYVERNRSALRMYMDKELQNNGDFGLLDNQVDLFEESYFVY